jgi:hypothetical protein
VNICVVDCPSTASKTSGAVHANVPPLKSDLVVAEPDIVLSVLLRPKSVSNALPLSSISTL